MLSILWYRKRSVAHVAPLSAYGNGQSVAAGVGDETSAPVQQDTLELLWVQVTSLQKRDWMETAVTRPYIYFDEILVKSMQHALPKIIIPRHNPRTETSPGDVYPCPSVTFRLFGTADAPEDCGLPPSRAVERCKWRLVVPAVRRDGGQQ